MRCWGEFFCKVPESRRGGGGVAFLPLRSEGPGKPTSVPRSAEPEAQGAAAERASPSSATSPAAKGALTDR